VKDVFVVSIESVDGRYWTCMDDREHIESWLLRTLERLEKIATNGVGYSGYMPRITQFAKIS
jgi:hypothetical protein